MRPPEFQRQCSARSKRSGCRCRNYACRDQAVCRMHGAGSRRGADHPNFRTGKFSKVARQAWEKLGRLFQRPVQVSVLLFPWTLDELAHRAARAPLQSLIVPPETLTIGERLRVLRAARRELQQELDELRAEAESQDL
jgi:hypothetical protein